MSQRKRSRHVPKSKLPVKGILKKAKTGDISARSSGMKAARFNEENLRETLHPENKDYGYQTIDEPKTPYQVPSDSTLSTNSSVQFVEFNVNDLKDRLEKLEENDQQRIARFKIFEVIKASDSFDKRRRRHYDEFKRSKEIESESDHSSTNEN